MRKILSVLLLPFVLTGVLLWSAATLARAAAEELFKRVAGLPIINGRQTRRREVI